MVFYGEEKCSAIKGSGEKCVNNGYYINDGVILCGVHCKDKTKVLPKNPNAKAAKEVKLRDHSKTVDEITKKNYDNGLVGNIILVKIIMRKELASYDGYLKVFPNYLHENRADGYGCSFLSPKSLGPVIHGQPNLPYCENLENFHQGNKVYDVELDINGNPTPGFFERLRGMYSDKTPYRHKYDKYPEIGKNVKYSYWIKSDGVAVKLSYFESRQIYCVLYEYLVNTNVNSLNQLNYLKSLIRNGTNIQICGYDAYPLQNNDTIINLVTNAYKDTSKPFGHELVLYCLLHDVRPWLNFVTLDNIIMKKSRLILV